MRESSNTPKINTTDEQVQRCKKNVYPKRAGYHKPYPYPKHYGYRKAALGVFYKLAHDQDLSGTVQLQAANAMLDRTEQSVPPKVLRTSEPQKPATLDVKDLKLSDEDLLNLIYDIQQRVKVKD